MTNPHPLQRTLRKEVFAQGIGIFTGEKTWVRICPSPAGSGIVFRRVDLEGSSLIPARLDFVAPSSRCTRLSLGDASVMMVEHLLSALYGMQIDNALVEVHGPEIPGMDGSSQEFVELFTKVGLIEQDKSREYLEISSPIFWSEGGVHLVALPSSEYRLSYVLHYPQSIRIGSQYYSFSFSPDRYGQEIAPCRTFSLYEEIQPFIEKGLIKGGGLENALVIRGNDILNPEGARFSDEMVRHKILDLIGDLSLIGAPILAHVIAICSGHVSNVNFAKIVYRNNLKNRDFGKEALQNSHSERTTIVERQGVSENVNFKETPTPPKTDSSSCCGIYQNILQTRSANV